MEPEIVFLIHLASLFLFSIILLLITGIHRIPKNHFAYLLLGRKMVKRLKEGWHFILPFVYQLSPYYEEGQFTINFSLKNKISVQILAEIINESLLIKNDDDLKHLVKKVFKSEKDLSEAKIKCENTLNNLGIKVINIINIIKD